ncbi:hypothetical protein BGX21_009394 [Mortierella sp. AD011]|nr:hypothetical protein BGX20_010899 [Mortierella sp. AD010]KAF9396815.1 hypothetical protein BGX21_009394 [Mortierella sp. AD011]
MKFAAVIATLACFAVTVQGNLMQVLFTYDRPNLKGTETSLGFDLNACTAIKEGMVVKSIKVIDPFRCTIYRSDDCHGRSKTIYHTDARVHWNPKSFKCVYVGRE